MRGGATIIVSVALLANSACGSEGKLQVRAMPTPLAQGKQPVPFRIAEALGQLALGNVALALESFRKAAREDPSSIEALAGIATCYDRMGRFDLSRRNYEAALAIAPGNTSLLGAFAASLDLQGRTAEAASVRREIATRLAAVAPVVAPKTQPTAPAVAIPAPMPPATVAKETPIGRSVTIALPPPRPPAAQPEPPPVKVALAQPRAAPKPAEAPAARAEPQPASPAARVEPPIAAQVVPPRFPVQAPVKGVGSVTIALPPPRPVDAKPVPRPTGAIAPRPGPRIERLSLGEVALITTPAPQWKATATVAARARFVPLRPTAGAIAEVRLLNAARVDRLAARTRSYLGNRGWRKVMIGDAEAARSKSLIVYPHGQHAVAARLSSQLGIAMAERPGVRLVTVLLGRDAARLAPSRARG